MDSDQGKRDRRRVIAERLVRRVSELNETDVPEIPPGPERSVEKSTAASVGAEVVLSPSPFAYYYPDEIADEPLPNMALGVGGGKSRVFLSVLKSSSQGDREKELRENIHGIMYASALHKSYYYDALTSQKIRLRPDVVGLAREGKLVAVYEIDPESSDYEIDFEPPDNEIESEPSDADAHQQP